MTRPLEARREPRLRRLRREDGGSVMKAWIVVAILAGGILFGEPLLVRAQAQAGAQVRGQAVAASQQAAQQQQAQAAPAGGQQRDPFRPIEIPDPAVDIAPNCTEAGMAGTLVGQVQLQGIASDVNGEWIAVVDNMTGRAYFLHQGDELCNGVVTRIDQDALVMEERTRNSAGDTRTVEVVRRPDDN